MSLKSAAIFEPKPTARRPLALALKKAGLTVSAATGVEHLKKEQLVLIGSHAQPAKLAAQIRKARPTMLIFAAQKTGFKASWADAVVPLPISPNDLKVRLEERQRKPAVPRNQKSPETAGAGPVVDPNTQFYTFPHFKELLFVEVKRARRYGFPLALALISLDAEKAHPASVHGQLMRALALAMRRSLRDTDYPVQYSDERVLLLMPHTDLAGSLIVARRICERVGRSTLQMNELTLQPTVSIGVSAGEPGREFGFSELVRHANDGLSQAMARGGNRVEFLSLAESSGEVSSDGVPVIPPLR
jgi:diguanylate cyclase (GGDEF)-like protein